MSILFLLHVHTKEQESALENQKATTMYRFGVWLSEVRFKKTWRKLISDHIEAIEKIFSFSSYHILRLRLPWFHCCMKKKWFEWEIDSNKRSNPFIKCENKNSMWKPCHYLPESFQGVTSMYLLGNFVFLSCFYLCSTFALSIRFGLN